MTRWRACRPLRIGPNWNDVSPENDGGLKLE
jgi:hypothetical protein